MKTKTLKWAPVILWATVIFFFSSLPQSQVPSFLFWDFVVKKGAHVFLYIVLFILVFRATNRNWIASYIITILYAAGDEIHQSFVPGRGARLYDVLGFDLTGANIAAFVLWKLQQKRRKKHKK